MQLIIVKQGIALTGRNSTGPPWSVGRPAARPQCYRRRQMTDDDRRQRPLLVWPAYTQASNTITTVYAFANARAGDHN